jgi:hypothetical protein
MERKTLTNSTTGNFVKIKEKLLNYRTGGKDAMFWC